MHGHVAHRRMAPGHLQGDNKVIEMDDSLANIVARADANKVATVYSVVYVTASATFTGSTAGYVTLGLTSTSSSSSTSTSSTQTSSSTTSSSSSSTSSTSSKSATAARTTSSSATSSSSSSSSSSHTSTTAAAAATSSSSSTSSITEDSSSGLSSAAKGGIAFAVLLLVALVAGLVFFIYRRKKKQQGEMGAAQRLADDEKRPTPPPNNLPTAAAAAPTRAPRLSIRPTSRFSMGQDPEKTAAALGALAENDRRKTPWERSHQSGPQNPFGAHAETVYGQNVPMTNLPASKSTASFSITPRVASPVVASPVGMVSSPFGGQANMPASAPSVAGGPAGAATAAAAADTAAAGNNVHRVQLDFKPSMDDELELKVGGLIRILHEYDDGWALCMTMDRSRQGVAPRTCLSKMPLKPRAPGTPPQGQLAGSMSKSSLVPAPLSPQSVKSQRSASGPETRSSPLAGFPTPPLPMDARYRSASAGSGASITSPTRKPVPARKPVPGQT